MRKAEQTTLFESGNEMAAYAARQIRYHVMGYYPITPSTQIAEQLDVWRAEGSCDIAMIPAEGEHSAAGICYGASVGGGRVFNATSANGLLYALEQLPVQSGTRFPMVLNVACRTVSGPLDIKGDHSDIMFALNTGWIILFANTPQQVYDMNVTAIKIAESVRLPVIVAFDGFFTSHQKQRCQVFANEEDVQRFIGAYRPPVTALDPEHPVTIGAYMNEPDLGANKYQLHQAMEEAKTVIQTVWDEFHALTGRSYHAIEAYRAEQADVLLVLLGSSYGTAQEAVDQLRAQGMRCGVLCLHRLRPFPALEIAALCREAGVRAVVVGDRQDSYGAGGGNLTLEVKAALQTAGLSLPVISRVYGLGGQDFGLEDAKSLLELGFTTNAPSFGYLSVPKKKSGGQEGPYFHPVTETPGLTQVVSTPQGLQVKGGLVRETTLMPKRLAPGHGACPGCGIFVNLNLLLRGIEGCVVLLFQTGCGMVVSTPYPQTAFKVPYVHNLFQNGAATLSGLIEVYRQRQKRGELPEGEITFVMVSGDGGMDIGMGCALSAGLRGSRMILFEYDNGGYMNTGYQLSYSTPKGARSATSHVGARQYGKAFFHKDMPQLMAAAGIDYVATVAESNPADFIRKAAKAQYYTNHSGMAYVKALSACPLNWGDKPNQERKVIAAAVDSCYFPLYEVEKGITRLTYDPEAKQAKIPVLRFLTKMGRTKHLQKEEYAKVVAEMQQEVDWRWQRLKARAEHPYL